MVISGIHWSWEPRNLLPKSHASAADSGATFIIVVQTHTTVAVLIAPNACEKANHPQISLMSPWFLSVKQASVPLILAPAISVNRVFVHLGAHVHRLHVLFSEVLVEKMRSISCPFVGTQFPVKKDMRNHPNPAYGVHIQASGDGTVGEWCIYWVTGRGWYIKRRWKVNGSCV